MWIGAGENLSIKEKANIPFTYSQHWVRKEINSVTIDYFGNVTAISKLEWCTVMNTFMPKPNMEYIVEYIVPKEGGCKYNIYFMEESEKKNVKVYEREFVRPWGETGDFCQPIRTDFN